MLAAHDLGWLLDRDYPMGAALVLVGDRYHLKARQRLALQRSLCSADDARARQAHAVSREQVSGRTLHLDGLNVVISVEVALGGGVLIAARDGTLRDLAGLRGSYRVVAETAPAIAAIADTIRALAPGRVRIAIDRPVSNSGRLRAQLLAAAPAFGAPLEVDLVASADVVLRDVPGVDVVASADSVVMERAVAWANLVAWVVSDHVPAANVIPLSRGLESGMMAP